MTFEIREARPEEYEALGELGALAYETVEPDRAYLVSVRDVRSRAARVPVLVAVDRDGTLLGSITYVPGPDAPYADFDGPDDAGFRMLAVAPSAQGRGVGRALVEEVITRARADGRAGLTIFTRPTMEAAHGLYASMGFTRDPSLDWDYEPGEWLWGYRLRF